MKAPEVEPPEWLTCLFLEREGSAPWLLRRARTVVWTDGHLVAKVYPSDMVSVATREQQMAYRASQTVLCAEPLGVDARPANTVGWWRYVDAHRAASPVRGDQLAPAATPGTAPRLAVTLTVSLPQPGHAPSGLLEALRPLAVARDEAAATLQRLPLRFVHADANQTNLLVGPDGSPVGLDFATSGAGPLVVDVACVAHVAAETGQADPDDVVATYGPHPELAADAVRAALTVVRANRAVACAWHPQWTAEGWARVEAFHAGHGYVFPPGDGPK